MREGAQRETQQRWAANASQGGTEHARWGAGVAGRQGGSSAHCSVGRAGAGPRQGVVWGPGVECGWEELEEGRVGGEGRSVKVDEAREGAGPAAGRDQVRGFGFSLSGNEVKGGPMKDFKLRSNSICYSKIVNFFFFLSTNYCLLIDQKKLSEHKKH